MASSRSSPPADRRPGAHDAAGPVAATTGPADSAASPVDTAVHAALAAFAAGRSAADAPRRVAVALSGGRDSMALLDAAARAATTLPVKLSAIHVHHGLSPRADDWAAFCTGACARRGVPLAIRRVEVARRGGQSLESAARDARYAAFAGLDVDAVALAHHADDQAETLLLQLLRGAGPHGVAAMARTVPKRAAAPALLRPLLGLTRRTIDAFVGARGIAHVEDDSNADVALRRNRLRHEVVPLLAAAFPGYPETLVRAAGHQAEAAQLLDELAALDAQGATAPALPGTAAEGGDALDRGALAALGGARARNLLRWFLRRQGLRAPSAARLAAMLRQLTEAAADARVAIAHDGATIGVHRGWIAVHRGPVPAWEAVWRGEPETRCCRTARWSFPPSTAAGGDHGIATAALAGRPLVARPAGGGERLRLAAGRPRRALTDLWREAGVPPWARAAWPLLFCGDELAAVPGLGVAPAFAARDGAAGHAVAWRPATRRPQSLIGVNGAPDVAALACDKSARARPRRADLTAEPRVAPNSRHLRCPRTGVTSGRHRPVCSKQCLARRRVERPAFRSTGGVHESTSLARARRRRSLRRRRRARAAADRHQVQPRRRPGHAEGQGGREVQGAGREGAARQGQGRGVPELDAVQGRRGDGSAVARIGADAGPVAGQVRPAGRARIRGVRPAVHLRRHRRAAQGHRRARPARRCSRSSRARASSASPTGTTASRSCRRTSR